MQSRFQSAAVTSLVLAFEPDAEHERLSPCNVGRLLGFHFVRNGRPRSNHPENGRSPVEGKNFASALAKCFFFFFSFSFFPRDRIPRLRRHSGNKGWRRVGGRRGGEGGRGGRKDSTK